MSLKRRAHLEHCVEVGVAGLDAHDELEQRGERRQVPRIERMEQIKWRVPRIERIEWKVPKIEHMEWQVPRMEQIDWQIPRMEQIEWQRYLG